MHHFLNVSGFPCFFLAPFNSLLNLSPFETVREPITIPESPVPRVPPFAVAWASERGFPRGCTGGLPAAARVWTERKLFIFGKMLRFTCIQQKPCVCVLFLFLFLCKGELCIFV